MWKFSRRIMMLPVVCFMIIVQQSCAFTLVLSATKKCRIASTAIRASSSDEGDDGQEPVDDVEIPQLPAIGESSFGARPQPPMSRGDELPLKAGEKRAVAFVSDKFEIQYTCKVCETRNAHRVSRIAYRNGVVITVCKGCKSKHLIADNLGWTDHDGGFQGDTNTIEDFFDEKGKKGAVNRVSQDVFQLEQLLDIHTDSGSIIGEDGNLAME